MTMITTTAAIEDSMRVYEMSLFEDGALHNTVAVVLYQYRSQTLT